MLLSCYIKKSTLVSILESTSPLKAERFFLVVTLTKCVVHGAGEEVTSRMSIM